VVALVGVAGRSGWIEARPQLAIVVVALLTIASVMVAFVLDRIARRVARRLRTSTRAVTARRSRTGDV